MRISSRRLLWVFNCMLLLAAALIFRPVRSWIDQVIIARSIHPNLKVQEIHLHANRLDKGLSVVEAKQFDWGSIEGNRRFGISAERAWIVIDNAALVDKVVTVPKAVLEHSRLYLDTVANDSRVASNPYSTNRTGSLWQQGVHDKFGDLQWNDLKQHLDGVLKLDDFSLQSSTKIDAWVASTEKIAAEGKQLGAGSDQLGNLLRDNTELQSRLIKVEKLIESEGQLRSQFASLDGEVDKKLEQIGSEFETHINIVKEKAADHKQQSTRRLANQLLMQTGERFLTRFRPYVEVADLLCRASTATQGNRSDEDYFGVDRPIVSLDNVTASGVFGTSDLKSPFRMQTDMALTSKAPFGAMARTNFRYQFDVDKQSIRVSAASRTEHQDFTDIQVQILAQSEPAIDPTQEQQTELVIGPAQWVVVSNGSSISGELYIDPALLPMLSEDNAALAKEMQSHLQSTTDEAKYVWLQLSGSWDSPTWSVTESALPEWLLQSIEKMIEQQIVEEQQQMIAKLEQYLSDEVDRLAAHLNQRLDNAKQRTARYTNELQTVKNTLAGQLTAEAKSEFARSGTDEVKR